MCIILFDRNQRRFFPFCDGSGMMQMLLYTSVWFSLNLASSSFWILEFRAPSCRIIIAILRERSRIVLKLTARPLSSLSIIYCKQKENNLFWKVLAFCSVESTFATRTLLGAERLSRQQMFSFYRHSIEAYPVKPFDIA